jgi:glycosyltransferase involved in cell wall biosynthesis
MICFIDPCFTYKNPSTNSLVCLVEDLLLNGEDVEIWTRELDSTLVGRVVHVRLPHFWAPWGVKPFAESILIHSIALWRKLKGKPRANTVVSTGFLYLPADFATVHFSHFEWMKQLRVAAKAGSRGVTAEFLKSLPGELTEILLFYNPWRTHLLPVSDAVAADIKRWAAPWKAVTVIPNMVLQEPVDSEIRHTWRTQARQELQIPEDEIILAFCSAGHFFRKGLPEVIATVMLLQAEGRAVRALVIGGRENTLRSWRGMLEAAHGEIGDAVIFTGMVDTPRCYLCCADAFFFPSRCEAFSLVEIEAAALGLPLFLTPHHGSEMILKDGINGHLLPWDPPGMAEIIADRIDEGLSPLDVPDTGRALSRNDYYQAWQKVIESRLLPNRINCGGGT